MDACTLKLSSVCEENVSFLFYMRVAQAENLTDNENESLECPVYISISESRHCWLQSVEQNIVSKHTHV